VPFPPGAEFDPGPAQVQASRTGKAEFVICDQPIDVTYIRLQTSWMYLVAVLDWYSRYVVSWELDDTLQLPFVLRAVARALAQATPEIWNSDQGSHFTSPQYRELLLAADVRISMDGKGRELDNIFVERLWRSVKYEIVSSQMTNSVSCAGAA
jgi:transposase InsO family protein